MNAERVAYVLADGRDVPFDRLFVRRRRRRRAYRPSDQVHHGAGFGRPGKVEQLSGAQLPHYHLSNSKTMSEFSSARLRH